jgi:L-threonylcarbamoyladenylate synthase
MHEKNIEILKNGGIGVISTDTVYGLVASAIQREAVEKVIKAKNRSDGKGFIVLISSIEDLKIFDVIVSDSAKIFLEKFWPGKVSIIFDSHSVSFDYLKKDGTIAFRLPDKPDLIKILKQTGPLIAPSANPEGQAPAKNIIEAKNYFADRIDFYDDEGEIDSAPSTLIKIKDDKIEVLREGAVKIN